MTKYDEIAMWIENAIAVVGGVFLVSFFLYHIITNY